MARSARQVKAQADAVPGEGRRLRLRRITRHWRKLRGRRSRGCWARRRSRARPGGWRRSGCRSCSRRRRYRGCHCRCRRGRCRFRVLYGCIVIIGANTRAIAGNEDIVLIIDRNRISPIVALGGSVVHPCPLFGPRGIVLYRCKVASSTAEDKPANVHVRQVIQRNRDQHSTGLVWTGKRSGP